MFSFFKRTIKYYIFKQKNPSCVILSSCNLSSASVLGKYVKLFHNVTIVDSDIGDYTYIQQDAVVNNARVGRFCSIAAGVAIGGGEHPLNYIGTSPIFYDNTCPLPAFLISKNIYNSSYISPTEIGADVWIGRNAIIKSGVKVGVGSVVGAGAVVVDDVEPYSIVVGVPARHVKWRFSKNLRESLIKSDWWAKDVADIAALNEFFDDPEEFLNSLTK